MKRILVIAFAISLVFAISVSIAATAQPEVPAPYAGQKNPFPWDDAAAQQAGKKTYQQSCLGCHGAKGDSLTSNFSAAAYAQGLQDRPDYYFWLLTEGAMSKGMPPFKSSLSETQRWQVLTYMWTLGQQPAAAPVDKPATVTAIEGATLQLTLPRDALSGKATTLVANIKNADGKPIVDADVKFFLKSSFFAKGNMELGDAVSDSTGAAKLNTTIADAGEVQVVAQYQGIENTATLFLANSNRPFYQTNVGIQMPALGADTFIGPVISESLDMGRAPASALRLGGSLSWLLLPVAGVLLIWSVYVFVMYQVLRITPSGKTIGSSRTFPYAALVLLALIGLSLALKVAIGPYSQLHLFQ